MDESEGDAPMSEPMGLAIFVSDKLENCGVVVSSMRETVKGMAAYNEMSALYWGNNLTDALLIVSGNSK